MTRTQRIEAVLKKHELTFHHADPMFHSIAWGNSPKYNEFITDLLTCLTPERNELLEIIDKHFVVHEYRLKADNKPRYKFLMDDLMAWASGETGQTWCEHLTRVDCKDGSGGWLFSCPNDSTKVYHTENWHHCPVAGCNAPRPT